MRKILDIAMIGTWGRWLRSENATSALCSPALFKVVDFFFLYKVGTAVIPFRLILNYLGEKFKITFGKGVSFFLLFQIKIYQKKSFLAIPTIALSETISL